MQNTVNYNLKKPGTADNYNVQNQNDNMDVIDYELKEQVDTLGSHLADNAAHGYTAADVITKLKTVDGHESGLDADKLDGKEAADFVNAVTSILTDDPNATMLPMALFSHSNCPDTTHNWYIRTYFFSTFTSSRLQVAYRYNSATEMYIRYHYQAGGGWSAWDRIVTNSGGANFTGSIGITNLQPTITLHETDSNTKILFDVTGGTGRVVLHDGTNYYNLLTFIKASATVQAAVAMTNASNATYANSGGKFRNILHGTADPAAGDGIDGDIYFKTKL